jgi:hypothetical protein
LLEKNFPEIEKATRFLQDNDIIRYGEKKFNEKRIIWGEDNFFDVFTYKFLEGMQALPLKNPTQWLLRRTWQKNISVMKMP